MCPFDVNRSRLLSLPPEVSCQFFCPGLVECKVVIRALYHQFLDFMPVDRLVVVLYQSHHSCVVRKLNDCVCDVSWCAVIGV